MNNFEYIVKIIKEEVGILPVERNNKIIDPNTGKEIIIDDIEEKIYLLKDEYKKTEYKRLRKAEYAKLNQDEMRFDDEVNGTTTWIDTIKAIKEKYPKPE